MWAEWWFGFDIPNLSRNLTSKRFSKALDSRIYHICYSFCYFFDWVSFNSLNANNTHTIKNILKYSSRQNMLKPFIVKSISTPLECSFHR